jgi:NAD(P)-dependent dehydrogenase (short-subunit alcohol dehydrogenase family)
MWSSTMFGVGGGSAQRTLTEDGYERIFAINVLAPYLLTALMPAPKRVVYLTSGLEAGGQVDLDDLHYERKPWSGMQAYSDSKLYDVMLAFAVARRWPRVSSNAVDPGWIRTRMGGPNATDGLPEGAETQVWLASADGPDATASGRYLKRRRELRANPAAYDTDLQERLLAVCARLTGATLPD